MSSGGPARPVMILYPAIDLKDGVCVRLVQGDMTRVTVFADDPAAQARDLAEAGSRWLHVVDLDGAFAGRPVNAEAVAAIVAAVDIPVQLGGGIRDMAAIVGWLDKGVERVILGTVALRDPDLVKTACRAYPGHISVGIDAREGRVAVEGWAETSDVAASELGLRFEQAGVAAMIYTDIGRDGTLEGVNGEAVAAFAGTVTTPVIASGGVASLADLVAVKALAHLGVEGIVVGRALYDGRIDVAAALRLLA